MKIKIKLLTNTVLRKWINRKLKLLKYIWFFHPISKIKFPFQMWHLNQWGEKYEMRGYLKGS